MSLPYFAESLGYKDCFSSGDGKKSNCPPVQVRFKILFASLWPKEVTSLAQKMQSTPTGGIAMSQNKQYTKNVEDVQLGTIMESPTVVRLLDD